MNERVGFTTSHGKSPGFGSHSSALLHRYLLPKVNISRGWTTTSRLGEGSLMLMKDFNPDFAWFGIKLPLLQLHPGFFPVPVAGWMLGDPDIPAHLLCAQEPNTCTLLALHGEG